MTTIKLARDKDSEFVRQVRNEVAAQSINYEYVSIHEHSVWWKKLKERGIKLYVIRYDNQKAGYIRINTHSRNEISIAIIKKYRDRGIGRKAMSLLPPEKYIAEIKTNNKASLHFFKNIGFNVIDKVYILQKGK